MQVGDLVVAIYDMERGIHCVGLVTDINNSEHLNIKVHWLVDNRPLVGNYGWWRQEKLKKFE